MNEKIKNKVLKVLEAALIGLLPLYLVYLFMSVFLLYLVDGAFQDASKDEAREYYFEEAHTYLGIFSPASEDYAYVQLSRDSVISFSEYSNYTKIYRPLDRTVCLMVNPAVPDTCYLFDSWNGSDADLSRIDVVRNRDKPFIRMIGSDEFSKLNAAAQMNPDDNPSYLEIRLTDGLSKVYSKILGHPLDSASQVMTIMPGNP